MRATSLNLWFTLGVSLVLYSTHNDILVSCQLSSCPTLETVAPGGILSFMTPSCSLSGQPAATQCTPASGTSFPSSDTSVNCTCGQSSCTFPVYIVDCSITSTCKNGGSCSSGMCTCPSGASSLVQPFCELDCRLVPSYCANGGTCSDTTGICQCTNEYIGTRCEIPVDTTPPVVSNCPADIRELIELGSGGTVVNWVEPTATDLSNVVTVDTTTIPVFFTPGTVMITYTFTDLSGNTAECSFNVVVVEVDTTPPEINLCPTPITDTVELGNPTMIARWPEPTATDSSGVPQLVSRSFSPGDPFPVGATTVQYLFRDNTGNTAMCQFCVTIIEVDTTPPEINLCPTPITDTVELGNPTMIASWPEPTATDSSGVPQLVSRSFSPGDPFPVGATTVQYLFRDNTGNTAMCQFCVTIIEVDTTPPVCMNLPADVSMTVELGVPGLSIDIPEPTCFDTSRTGRITARSHNPGDFFGVGNTAVTYTCSDESNNRQTCFLEVRIATEDTIPPEIMNCPSMIDETVELGTSGRNIQWVEPTATDRSGTPMLVVRSHAPGAFFPVGVSQVEYTFRDSSGNEAVCAFMILISEDINECDDADLNTCVTANGGCVNTIGSFTCFCDDGFTGDGQRGTGCSGEDGPCASVDCGDKAICVTGTSDEYTCQCIAGYSGIDYRPPEDPTCQDINECDDVDLNACVTANGGCTNTVGGFTCFCEDGFTGDGQQLGTGCSDIDECIDDNLNICVRANGGCTNIIGSFSCVCDDGFTGDGRTDGTGCTAISDVFRLDLSASNSTLDHLSVTFRLPLIGSDNQTISCYAFVIIKRALESVDDGVSLDERFPFEDVASELTEDVEAYRALVLNHKEYSSKSTVTIGMVSGETSTCLLGRGVDKRKKRSRLLNGQELEAKNSQLESDSDYLIFLRTFSPLPNGTFVYKSSEYGSFRTLAAPSTVSAVAIAVVIIVVGLLLLVIIVVIIKKKKTKKTPPDVNKAVSTDYENEGNLASNATYINEPKALPRGASSYEPVDNPAMMEIQLHGLQNKHDMGDAYEDTSLSKQDSALPKPPVDTERVIYEDMPDGNDDNYNHALYNSGTAPLPFKVSDLPGYVERKKLDRVNGLAKEFMILPQNKLEPWTVATQQQNVGKNRYPDILPYDHTMVNLVIDSRSHYYNANFIMDQQNRQSFIAAQGPDQHTVEDFLRLICQEKVAIVVMVTDLEQSGKPLCLQYWPDQPGHRTNFGGASVEMRACKNYPDYSVRELDISIKGSNPVNITQFHYHAWPYQGVAEQSTSLLTFIQSVKDLLERKHYPLLTHCSDGSGATGTFIALFCLLTLLKQSEEISVYDFVKKMRKNRISMVGTKAQYVFIYDVLLEAYLSPTSVYSPSSLKGVSIKRSKMISEFELLKKPNFHIGAQSGSAKENQHRNRFPGIVPIDVYRPYLKCSSFMGGNDYINASFVNTSACYWPSGGEVQYGSIVVKSVDTTKTDVYTQTVLEVKHQDIKEVITVKHFQLLVWPDRKKDFRQMLGFSQSVGSNENKAPVIVHCMDSISRSGVFVIIQNEIQRLKDTGTIDIHQSVNILRQRSPQCFPSVDDYILCYELMRMYVQSCTEF